MKKKYNDERYKFSVLMSVYNKEVPEHFEQAIESILVNQTLIPDEFILIVDGPVGECIDKVIVKYKEKFSNVLKVYRIEKNVGLGNALNFGLKKCSYDFVARADSDDINVNNRFELQIERFKLDEKLDVLGGFIEEFEYKKENPINIKKMPLEHVELFKMAKIRNPINHMSVMFKKEAVMAAGEYKHMPYLEDYFLWVRVLINEGRMETLDKTLVYARVGNGMLARRSNKAYLDSWKSLNEFMFKEKMINKIEQFRNVLCIYGFILTPISIKKKIYRFVLRN